MKKISQYLVVYFAVSLLVACAKRGIDDDIPQSWRTEAVKSAVRNTPSIETEEIVDALNIPGVGVSINFEGTQGWRSIKNKTNEFQYFRYIDRRHIHTAAIRIYPIFPPRTQFESVNDFLNYTKKDLEKLRDKNGNDIEFTVEPSNEKAPLCVAFHRKTLLTDEKNHPGTSLVGEAYEYICKHPNRPRVFINLHYSERFPAVSNVADVQSRANSMLSRITFSE